MMMALRIARRELRAGVRGLRVVLACLALGVAAIAAVGSLRAGIDAGLASDGTRILGGDISVQGGYEPLPASLHDWLQGRGAAITDGVGMRSMLAAPSSERLLVELKAVDAAWPLIGTATFAPVGALAPGSIAVDPLVLDRLGLKVGDTVQIGNAKLKLGGVITNEPDSVSSPSILGPRVLMRGEDMDATGLIQPGAIIEHQLRARFPDGTNIKAAIADLRREFPGTGWRIRDSSDAAPGIRQFLDRTSLFMTLVGLTSLLVGGIGVANGVRSWLEARARSIAILRCLGASPRLVFASSALQVGALAAIGIGVGVLIGGLLPMLASRLLVEVLPVPPISGFYWKPLALAAGFGALTAATFALWPLSRAMSISGAALFRDAVLPDGGKPKRWLVLTTLLLSACLIALTIVTATEWKFAIGFCGAAVATLALFRIGAWALIRTIRGTHASKPWARLGLGNLSRPGNATPLMLVSVGLGLSTLAAVALIQGNIQAQVADQLPANAPSFFFIDIQNTQMAQFRQILAAEPGVIDMKEVPNLRARVVAVGGVPAEQVKATPDTVWALRGDRGLTYAATPPDGTTIVAGTWWPADYNGPPLVSFDANLARGWGVTVGDTIRVNVLGRDIDLKVANLRDIAWRSMGINYAMVASPGLLDRAPHTHIATVRATDASQPRLLRAVTQALPNVSGIRVADVLAAVGVLFGQLSAALAATGSLTLIAGTLVLGGAVASGQRRRINEAVILKSLGASRAQIRAAWLVEFGVLGLTAGIIAALIGTAASFAVTHYVMATTWVFLPGTLALTILGCMALMLVFGYFGTEQALRTKVAPLLRND